MTGLEQRRDTRLLRILGMSRYAVGIAVVGTFVAATALLVYGAVEVLQLVGTMFGAGNMHVERGTSPPLLLAISAVKAFLVAIVLYVIAVGFYQLFFHRLPLPAWLVVEDLAELELKLVEVVISTLGVVFLGQVVTWDGQRDLQGFGIATALVIGALAYAISRVAPRNTVVQPPSSGRNESATDAQPGTNDSAQRGA
jgi:uncharacterized membrane protein YqhA